MLRLGAIIASFLLLLTCCTGRTTDGRLVRIAAEVAVSPNEALAAFDSIDHRSLPDADRHFYDFLTIKARDKAYITHESDSLILSVVEYYSTQSNDTVYPEALYYAGRVYSDMGDYPTALDFFQKALDCLETSKDNVDLHIRVLSQTGRLLNSLRLYDEAIPYIQSSLAIERQRNDTLSIIYDLQLMGGILLRAERYPEAEKIFKESLNLSHIYNSPDRAAKSRMYLAGVKYELGQLDSALLLIRHTPEQVSPIERNSALAYAASIYLDAGIIDTAYLYSHELIHSPAQYNHQIGYHVILSPELRKYVHPDSLEQYINDYSYLIESFYNENEQQYAINQLNVYNYSRHERLKREAEKRSAILEYCVIGLIIAALIMSLFILWLKNRDKNRIIELRQAIENIGTLKQELVNVHNPTVSPKETDFLYGGTQANVDTTMLTNGSTKQAEQELRRRLRDELMAMYESYGTTPKVSSVILHSEAFQALSERLNAGKNLKEDDPLWRELENVVLECSPKFKKNLVLLTSGKLTRLDMHTALLLKCGFKPSQMTILLGRSNGAIISRRENLCMKVLDQKMRVKVIDGIIRLL